MNGISTMRVPGAVCRKQHSSMTDEHRCCHSSTGLPISKKETVRGVPPQCTVMNVRHPATRRLLAFAPRQYFIVDLLETTPFFPRRRIQSSASACVVVSAPVTRTYVFAQPNLLSSLSIPPI